MKWLSVEQSNSSMIVGDVAMLKLFRRVTAGPHPEAEMGRYLTEQGFANIAPLLGEVVRVDPDGERHALAIAQGFIRNQGDAWTWTLDLLMRGLSDLTAGTEEAQATRAEQHEDYDAIATLLGRRLGEMHAVLARDTGRSGVRAGDRRRRDRGAVGGAGRAATGGGVRRARCADGVGRGGGAGPCRGDWRCARSLSQTVRDACPIRSPARR